MNRLEECEAKGLDSMTLRDLEAARANASTD
jgi:hypothetical protein